MSVPGSKSGRAVRLAVGSLIIFTLIAMTFAAPAARAQTQTVTATPGVVNLGMTSTVAVTAPVPGTYSVAVVKPNGTRVLLNYTFTAQGQTENATFGNATSGFKSAVDQVGTYNIFVEQGSQVVGATSLYATNKLNLGMDLVTGGTCTYISGGTRGTEMLPRFYITYASNGAPITNVTKGISVTYSLPDGTIANAIWHPPSGTAPDQGGSGGDTGYYFGELFPNWNYAAVGTWDPTVTVSDAFGNTATYKYNGAPFTVSPATFAMGVQLVNAKSGLLVAGLYDGESVAIKAAITYPTNAEPVPGFVAALDSAARGGQVDALVGWGFYNATTNTFGGKTPGGLIATVAMTYSSSSSTWTGSFTAQALPPLQAGTNFMVVVTASDKASPPNTGLETLTLPPAAVQTTTTTSTQTLTLVYAAIAANLLTGVILGYVVRARRKSSSPKNGRGPGSP